MVNDEVSNSGVKASDLDYPLPPESIPDRPLPDRAASKLLYVQASKGSVEHRQFRELPDLLPPHALLVVNNTRVIHARIPVSKPTGGAAEILCISPVAPSRDPALALQARGESTWECLVGGKNIPAGMTLSQSWDGITLQAEILERRQAEATVRLRWQPANLTLGEFLNQVGKIPLPPYFKRAAESSDEQRYQTVYSKQEGSVAAPTAGLHFTAEVLDQLQAREIGVESVTLHVGAGTFKPVEVEEVEEHPMHAERIDVSIETLRRVRHQLQTGHPVVAVGTTSMRTLESLYWTGVRELRGEFLEEGLPELLLDQWDWKRLSAQGAPVSAPVSGADALGALISALETRKETRLQGQTRIMIAPGYPFAICSGLVTNFHQPRSTLLLLVAAFVGKELWRRMYAEAIAKGYRFLSYGDSSLLWR